MTTEPAGVLPPRYHDPERIGVGGMGEVYRAVDDQLGRPVAVKLIVATMAGDDQIRERFLREARVAARITHPNVVVVHDVGEWRGRPYMVMEYCPGGSIDGHLTRRPVGVDEVLSWVSQAAAGIDAGHAAGVVHRDIKPHNLLLAADGSLKVSDFGIARVVDAPASQVTATGLFLGSVGYAAPEVLLGERATAAADVYALGVVAYELLTGGRPFGGRATAAEMAATLSDPIPPASTRGVGIPSSVDPVFAWALDRDPSRRPPTARRFADALAQAMRAGPGHVVPPVPQQAPRQVTPSSGTRRLPPAPPAAGAPAPPPGRGGRSTAGTIALVVAGVLAAGVVGAGVAYLASGSSGTEASTSAATTAPPRTVTQVVTTEGATQTVTRPVTVTDTQDTTVVIPDPPTDTSTPDVTLEEAIQLTDDAAPLLDTNPEAALATQLQALPTLEAEGNDASGGYLANGSYNAGEALRLLGRCEEAIPYLERAVALDSGTDDQKGKRLAALESAQNC